MKRYAVLSVLLATGLSGCASVIDGTSQPMTIVTNPEGAECKLMRNGELLARITTPQTVNIKKTKHDINVECEMEGFHKSTEHVDSEIQDATWGNIILGGGIGWAVDSASGADNKYKEHVTLTMVPLSQPSPAVVAEPTTVEGAPLASSSGEEAQPGVISETSEAEVAVAAPKEKTAVVNDVTNVSSESEVAASGESATSDVSETASESVAAEDTVGETEAEATGADIEAAGEDVTSEVSIEEEVRTTPPASGSQ